MRIKLFEHFLEDNRLERLIGDILVMYLNVYKKPDIGYFSQLMSPVEEVDDESFDGYLYYINDPDQYISESYLSHKDDIQRWVSKNGLICIVGRFLDETDNEHKITLLFTPKSNEPKVLTGDQIEAYLAYEGDISDFHADVLK